MKTPAAPGSRSLSVFARLEGELLARHGRLIHGAAFDDGEYRHPLVVPASGRGVLLAATDFATGPIGTHRAAGGRGNGDRTHARVKRELAAGEFVQRAFVGEEYDLTVGLAAGLGTDADLIHRRGADELALLIHTSGTVRCADDEAALTDGREDGVAIAIVEIGRALAGILEQRDGVGVRARQQYAGRQQ